MKYAPTQKRVFAKFLDLLVVMFLGLAWRGGPGSIIGFLYSLVADGLPFKKWEGQSIGKKLLGLRVMSGHVGGADWKTSIVRNAAVGLVTFFMIIPFWGWILSIIVGVPLLLIELSLMIKAERHQRLGDVMAESVVVEAEYAHTRASGTLIEKEPTVL